jgi:spermidine/putrescine transport system substrate-binding protein
MGVRLALGRDPGYDLVVISDWMVVELIDRGWVQPLSAALVPNAARLVPEFRNQPLPDVRCYALPWQGGFAGIAWNLAATHRPVTSMSDLLTSPDLHGRVGLVGEMRDVMGLIMLDMGMNPAAFSGRDFSAALARLDRAVSRGQILTVTNNYSASSAPCRAPRRPCASSIRPLPATGISSLRCNSWPGGITSSSCRLPSARATAPGSRP